MIYRRSRTGLVLWIVPTTQIYRQTIKSFTDRDHPYRQHLDLASGGFQEFFPPEDDIKGQEVLLKRFPNLDTYEKETGFWGRQIKTSLGNTLRMLSPLIILDEGHKACSEGAQDTLRCFNPSLIVELSATPAQSNVLVEISGREIHREEMIKLDLHVVNKASPDWKDTLLAGYNKRNALEEKAKEYEANTGISIRPICLIQAERTGAEQRGNQFIHSEDVREQLIKALGISADEIAVKTSEKDELKEVYDIGGLMAADCKIRYIITKQALQEGWDCAFAYVLVILTNPSSKNGLTQLVGRILRQPFARKTGVRDLDESYVYCFQQRAGVLLDSVRRGFEEEGLGDLHGQIVPDDDNGGRSGTGQDQIVEIRDKFKKAARRTVLPVFLVKEGPGWRPVKYEADIVSKIQWERVDLEPVRALALSTTEEKDIEQVTTLADDQKDVIQQKNVIRLREGAIRADPVFMTRQMGDIVPNPWLAHEFAVRVLESLRGRYEEKLVINNFVFIIEELCRRLEQEKDRLAEDVFIDMLRKGKLRFLVIGNGGQFEFPEKMMIKAQEKRLTRKDGTQLQLSLFEMVPEGEFNDTEKTVAWYLESQKKLFFWYRNRVRFDYSIQGWRRHRIYPDFIFTSKIKETAADYAGMYVIETKGMHLVDNDKTNYIRKLFDICAHEAKAIKWGNLGLPMTANALRFEVLAEAEWKAKLNAMLADKS